MDDRKHIQTIIERKCVGSSFCTQTPPTLDYSGGRVNLFCLFFFYCHGWFGKADGILNRCGHHIRKTLCLDLRGNNNLSRLRA